MTGVSKKDKFNGKTTAMVWGVQVDGNERKPTSVFPGRLEVATLHWPRSPTKWLPKVTR